MKQVLILIAGIMLFTQISVGQTLIGRITDKGGNPVQYATVYIEELRQGTTSNTRGDYKIRLNPGRYTVTYQSLGYMPVFENIIMADSTITRNIVLPEQVYAIPEVKISPSGEDPAYFIMRRTIGLAPYYLNNISHYKANVYLKGNLMIKKIPRLLQKSMRMGQEKDNVTVSAGGKPQDNSRTMKEGDFFMMESYNEIEFTAPDRYVQKVISSNSTFPEQGNEISPMEYIQASFYQPVLADMAISPLAPQAFSYYNYRYDGATLQGNYTLDKIEVIPKRKSQQLFSGTIYVIEDLWCLQSVDLTNENLAGTIRVRELYIPVQEEVWMPVSHQFDINLGFLGIRADAGYSSSVKYLDVKPDTSLEKPEELASGYPGRYALKDTVVTKTEREIEKILQKKEMTNRDMVRLSTLMKKESAAGKSDTVSKSLEIKDKTVTIIEKDAGKKDSAYWTAIRPIPLSELEVKSLETSRKADTTLAKSSGQATDSTLMEESRKKSPFTRAVKNIAWGHIWSDTTGFSFTYGGLINLKSLSFNTVDGFIYGFDFRFNKQYKKNRSLGFYPEVRYAFSREKVMWRLNTNYSTGGLHPKQIFLRTGMASKDIGTGGGINPLLNSISSLLFRKNYLKLYESRFMTLGYGTEITNGMKLEISGGFEDRLVLENNTDFSIFRPSRKYTDNIPPNEYLTRDSGTVIPLYSQKHYELGANFTFTPFQKYRVYRGNKIPEGSDWPTFTFIWKHMVNQMQVSDRYRHFNMLRFEVSQTHETGPFGEFRWQAGTGGYLDNRNLPFFDFFHFNSQPLILLIDEYQDAYRIPHYYSLSSPEFFGEVHLKYTTPYLLLKLLPGLSNTLIRENLSLSYIGRRYHSSYTEIGYTLSEIFLLGEAGVFIGFDDLKFRAAGVRFSLRLN